MKKTLGFIGCGKMAYAMLKGISSQSNLVFADIYCHDINPERMELFASEFRVVPVVEQKDLMVKADIIVLAVKPHQIHGIVKDGQGRLRPSQLIISIAAGIKLHTIEELIPGIPVIRVMPNTPCMVGEGSSALTAGTAAGARDLDIARQIFATMGLVVVVPEKSLDAVTALSGGGPAFVLVMAEAMINGGIQAGLDAELAKKLVVQTVRGSMKLLQETGEHPGALREQVCSPGGTTIEGVKVLEQYRVRAAFMDAVFKACQKSIEIGKDSY